MQEIIKRCQSAEDLQLAVAAMDKLMRFRRAQQHHKAFNTHTGKMFTEVGSGKMSLYRVRERQNVSRKVASGKFSSQRWAAAQCSQRWAAAPRVSWCKSSCCAASREPRQPTAGMSAETAIGAV